MLHDLFYSENGKLAPASVLATLSFALFVYVSLYLLHNHIEWKHYDTFTAATMGTSAGGLIPSIIKVITERVKTNV